MRFIAVLLLLIQGLLLTTGATAATLDPPTRLVASIVSAAQIMLKWRDSASETAYKIERAPSTSGPWVVIGAAPANAKSYVDASVAPQTSYAYRVRSTNGVSDSSPSNVISITTPAGTPPPTVSITTPPSGTTYTVPQTVAITASASSPSGVTKVEFYDDTTLKGTVTSPPYAFGWTISGIDNGAHAWTARAYNGSTSATSTRVTLNVNIDTGGGGGASPPLAGSVTASGEYGSFVVSPFSFAAPFTSTTALASCEYSTNGGGTWAPATIAGTVPNFTCSKNGITASNGQALALTMRATNGGGTAAAAAIARTIDSAPPTTGNNAAAAWMASDQIVTLTASDGGGAGVASTQYCTDTANSCAPAQAGTATGVTCAAGSTCQTYVRYRSTDNLSNVEATKSVLVRIDKAAPTNGTLTATAGNAQVQLTWSGISDVGSGLSASAPYKLVFATGSIPSSCSAGTVLLSGSSTSITHLGVGNGTTYYYRLCATDAAGNVSAGATASATPFGPNQPPVANAGSDQTGPPQVAISFSGTGSYDPDGSIVSYSWNFGDGASGSGASVSHAYASAGTYTATLTVTDNAGASASDTAVVTVGSVTATGAFRWATRAGGGAGNAAYTFGTAVDPAGNVIVAGTFSGSINLGGGALTSRGSSDIFIAKYSPSGVYLWAKSFGDTAADAARGLAVDASGNIVVVGSYTGTINFGGGPLPAYYSGFGSPTTDIFVAKFAPTGAHLWSKSFGNFGDDIAYGVAMDRSGNAVVVGSFKGWVSFGGSTLISQVDSLDVFLAKFAPDGQHIWSQRFAGQGDDYGYGVAVDPGDNIVLTGTFVGSVDFGGGALVSAGNADIVVAKYSPAGLHLWSKALGSIYNDNGFAVAVDGGGNVVVTGYIQGSADFGGGALTPLGFWDTFVAKYSPAGAHLWSKLVGGVSLDEGMSVATDGGGNVLLAGAFQGTANFGGGAMTSAGGWDIAAIKYSPSGTALWTKRFGGTGDDQAYTVTTDASGNAIFAGNFRGTVDFGGGPLTATGFNDIFILSLSP